MAKKLLIYGFFALLALYVVSVVVKTINMEKAKSNAQKISLDHSKILKVVKMTKIEQCSRGQQGPYDNGRKDCYLHFATPVSTSAEINSLNAHLQEEGWDRSSPKGGSFRQFFGDSMCSIETGPAASAPVFFERHNITVPPSAYYYHLYCHWSDVLSIS